MTTRTRETTVRLDAVTADCLACPWKSTARNALGNAARHHDASGHPVTIETTRTTTYGNLDAYQRSNGQTSLDMALDA